MAKATGKDKLKLNAAAELPPIIAKGADRLISDSTFRDYGERLPIGIIHGGMVHRAFALRPWRMKQERHLAKLKNKQKRLTLADFVTEVLAYMLTQLGPHSDFQALGLPERKLEISKMYMGDVLYIYITLRIQALGEVMHFEISCPNCSESWKAPADLLDTDVTVVEDAASSTDHYVLRDGIELPDGSEEKQLVLNPPRWTAMRALSAKGINMAEIKLRSIATSIMKVGDGKYPPTHDLLDTLTKYDMESLYKHIDENAPGPDLTLEVECPDCEHEFKDMLNWSWDFFFGGASL